MNTSSKMPRSAAHGTKADAAYDWIRERIQFAEWEPDARIRIDRIADELEFSRIPVREALSRLAAEGLLVGDPHRGYRLKALSSLDLRDIYDTLSLLEPLAARLACAHLAAADLDEAAKILDDMENTEVVSSWVAKNVNFHMTLYRPCGRPRLLRTIENLMTEAARGLQSGVFSLDFVPKSNEEHRALLETFESEDPEAAAEHVRSHIEKTEHALLGQAE